MINLINDIGYGLLCKVCDSVHGCHLHFLVDSLGMYVKRTSEDVWETDDVVYLVGIVATSGRHQYVGAACHGILIANLWNWIGECEDNRVFCH